MKRDASWVIRRRDTGEVLFETFNPKVVAALNLDRYEAVSILDYLEDLNRKIRAARDAGQKVFMIRARKKGVA